MTKSTTKYENAVLYLCDKLGGTIQGKKKLAKLLYYVDFDRFEYKESMSTVTGDTYKSWKMGPVPEKYMEVVATLEKKNMLKRSTSGGSDGYRPAEVFTAVTKPDVSVFDNDDIAILDRVVKNYGNLDGKKLEILTHQEAPYIATEPDHEIAYELAFYRETDFSDVLANARRVR